ncbi:hypothetical protein BGZ70_003540 [Mortierella alpina]|uniref:DUF6589 domain-containing protein n=1 Tax=Mortierella alpina TaxID=64518 RepID=A0A9P6IS67_MORAP|nr:hypothetical protein BGZ70_003540 [Mortierella alpina]
MAQVATSYVVNMARNELVNLSKSKYLHLSRDGFTASDVDNFSLARIQHVLQTKAPVLTKILRGLTELKPAGPRQRSLALPVIGSIVATTFCRTSNYLQVEMGLYFYSAGCTRKVIDTLHGTGLCVSFSTINRLLEDLTKNAKKVVRLAAKREPFLLVYDNINLAKRKHDQRVDNLDDFENGTTATMIIGRNLGSVQQVHQSYSRLSPSDVILDQAEMAHIKKVYQAHFVQELRNNKEGYGRCSPVPLEIHLLPAEKTKAHPLPTMKIDESSLEGNKMVMETIIEKSLGLEKEWFTAGKAVIVAGDLSTVKKLRSLKYQREDERTPYNRLDWITPVAQLFHMQMALGRTLLRHYRGTDSEHGSLSQIATLLGGRNRIFSDNPDFHSTDEFLRHVFSATVLRLWDVSVTAEDTEGLAGCKDDTAFNNLVNAKMERIIDGSLNPDDINDPSSANATLFLRDMTLYLELSSAIKVGDIGRIDSALKWLTIVFHAGSNSNYAYELLHFRSCAAHLWDPDIKDAVLASMLVNMSGTRQGWKPTDLYQEHCNRTIKHVFHNKQGDMTFDMLRERISMNIETFDTIKARTEQTFKAPPNKRKHAAVSALSDLEIISMTLSEHSILGLNPTGKPQDPTVKRVKHLFMEGAIALLDKKRMDTFIQKHADGSQWMGGGAEDMEENDTGMAE